MAALLVGGTARSSNAARRNAQPAQKNHSTTVTPKKKTHGSKHVVSTGRPAETKARPTAAKSASLQETAKSKAQTPPSGRAAQADRTNPRVAQTPRATPRPLKTVPSSSRLQVSRGAEEAAVREALARRRMWTTPRQQLIEPAQVQDPPVPAELRSVRVAPAVAEVSAPVQMALAGSSADQRAGNEDLIREALRNRGARYIWGGSSRGGFDCSGFTRYIFLKQRNLKLPHSASAQARMGAPVGRDELQAGDLLFFSTYNRGISHVGIYVGDNRFIHAANQRRGVRMDAISGYYANRYRGARRITPAPLRFTPDDLNAIIEDRSELPPTGPE